MSIGLRASLGALEERPFRLLWLGQTSSAVGDALIPVALAFALLQELDASAADLGLVLAAFSLSRVAFTLVGGVWADRLQRRLVMLVCDGIRAAVEFFTFGMLVAGAMELWMFGVTAALFGAASAFFGPASIGLIPETASRERLQQANALIAISRNGTSIFGPAVSGALVATIGPAWLFAVDGATFVASAGFQ
ncbi:MAG: MFS transporter [Gaiellaceae bacterium]